jgi:hypothetical protein
MHSCVEPAHCSSSLTVGSASLTGRARTSTAELQGACPAAAVAAAFAAGVAAAAAAAAAAEAAAPCRCNRRCSNSRRQRCCPLLQQQHPAHQQLLKQPPAPLSRRCCGLHPASCFTAALGGWQWCAGAHRCKSARRSTCTRGPGAPHPLRAAAPSSPAVPRGIPPPCSCTRAARRR